MLEHGLGRWINGTFRADSLTIPLKMEEFMLRYTAAPKLLDASVTVTSFISRVPNLT